LLHEACSIPAIEKARKAKKAHRVDKLETEYSKLVKKQRSVLTRAAKDVLDREFEQHGHRALLEAFDREVEPSLDVARDILEGKAVEIESSVTGTEDEVRRQLLTSFARLDGYNLWLRSLETTRAEGKPGKDDDGKEAVVPTQLSWAIPVRAWAKSDDWGEPPKGKEKVEKSTHGEDGTVLQEYLHYLKDNGAFDEDGSVKDDFRDRLDPACLEACDFNLAAGRHKPFTFDAGKHRPPAELIGELQDIHAKIQERLGRLREMVEGKT